MLTNIWYTKFCFNLHPPIWQKKNRFPLFNDLILNNTSTFKKNKKARNDSWPSHFIMLDIRRVPSFKRKCIGFHETTLKHVFVSFGSARKNYTNSVLTTSKKQPKNFKLILLEVRCTNTKGNKTPKWIKFFLLWSAHKIKIKSFVIEILLSKSCSVLLSCKSIRRLYGNKIRWVKVQVYYYFYGRNVALQHTILSFNEERPHCVRETDDSRLHFFLYNC